MDAHRQEAVVRYTGTVLGGPHDGEIITLDYPVLRLPNRPVVRGFCVDPIPVDPSPMVVSEYSFHRDDDARGWWMARRR